MAEVTVTQFAEVLKVPVDKLLTQLDEAGIRVGGANDIISDDAKMELLTSLRRSHGRDAEAAAPRKITLQRKSQQEIKLASTQGRARTVAVEVRRKKTYLNRTVLEEEQRTRQDEMDRVKGAEDAQRAEAERREAERRALEQTERERLESEARRLAEDEARRRDEAAATAQAEQHARDRADRDRADGERRAAEPVGVRMAKPIRQPGRATPPAAKAPAAAPAEQRAAAPERAAPERA